MVNYRKRNRVDSGDEKNESLHGTRVQRKSYSLRSNSVEKFKNVVPLNSKQTKTALTKKNETTKRPKEANANFVTRSGLRSGDKLPLLSNVEQQEMCHASCNSKTNDSKEVSAKYVRKLHTNTKKSNFTNMTEPNTANTNNFRQLHLRPVIEKADKEEKPGLELCEVENKISIQNRIPIVVRGLGEISQGSIVLVKWPSFPYWPARVLNICRNIANVMFFGDRGRTAKVKVDRLFQLMYNTNYIIYILQTQQWARVYTTAIREAEICSGIEFDKSLLNNFS